MASIQTDEHVFRTESCYRDQFGNFNYHYNWLRITGGEPFLDLERASELCTVLKLLEENSESFNNDVVIQTNGYVLGNDKNCREITKQLADSSLDVLVEISLKGTCDDEFSLITHLPSRSFYIQLKAVENLRKNIKSVRNLTYRVVMGFGPNNVSETLPTHMFIHPNRGFLLQMRKRWDSNFTRLQEDYLEESPSGHLGFSMACLVTQRWGIHPLRNIEENGMLLRTRELSASKRALYEQQ